MNKFDQHIKKKLSQQQAPPLDAWKNIEEKLDDKKKKRAVPFIFWISSSAACIGIASVFYFLNTKEINTIDNNIVKTKTIDKSSQKNNIISKSNTLFKPESTDTNNVINIVNNTNKYYKSNSYTQSNDDNLDHNTDIIFIEAENNISFSSIQLLDENYKSTQNQQVEDKQHLTEQYIAKNQTVKKEEVIDEKSIEEIIKEDEEKVKIEPKLDPQMKFAVSTFVSPTIFFNDESILSNSFDSHEIENKISMAYGAKIAYQVNDKLKVRTGISKLDFDQNTKDIVTSRISTTQNSSIEPLSSAVKLNKNNIKYNGNLQVLPNHEAYPISFYATEENIMNQKVEFVEIPLEIEYRLINNSRFNFSVIGGGSYMILTKNDIYIDNNTLGRNKLGKAENLNDFSYSANASLKFEYLLSQKAGINLEPNYKFLINPLKDFSNKDNSLLGIGLGFSYKF